MLPKLFYVFYKIISPAWERLEACIPSRHQGGRCRENGAFYQSIWLRRKPDLRLSPVFPTSPQFSNISTRLCVNMNISELV